MASENDLLFEGLKVVDVASWIAGPVAATILADYDWARTGLMHLVRTGNFEPAQSLPGMGDHPTAVALYAAIVTALFRREKPASAASCTHRCSQNGIWAAGCGAQARLMGADFSG